MGKKGQWFSSVKKALSPDSKEKKIEKSKKSKKKWFSKEKHLNSEFASLESVKMPSPPFLQPEVVKLTNGETEESKHAFVSVTNVAAEAAMATAPAAPTTAEDHQHTTDTRFAGKSGDEVAAIKIQTTFRGYQARRALRALRGLVRLKSLMEGPVVTRQAASTLRCMQTLSRVQSQIRSRRIRMSEENQALQKQLLQKHAIEFENMQIGEEWDTSLQSKEKIEANLLNKHEASMRRERALAYAFTHQQTWKNSSKSVNPMFMDPSNPTWGWSWLERWMAARPWEKEVNNDQSSVKNGVRNPGGEISKAYARHQLNSDKHSPVASQQSSHPPNVRSPSTPSKPASTVAGKLKFASPRASMLAPDDDSKSIASMQSYGHRRHSVGGSSVRDDESLGSSASLPSYMIPTESARAKSRFQSPLGAEKNVTQEAGPVSSVKKRLSYPPSPARPRRHSGLTKVANKLDVENNLINGVST